MNLRNEHAKRTNQSLHNAKEINTFFKRSFGNLCRCESTGLKGCPHSCRSMQWKKNAKSQICIFIFVLHPYCAHHDDCADKLLLSLNIIVKTLNSSWFKQKLANKIAKPPKHHKTPKPAESNYEIVKRWEKTPIASRKNSIFFCALADRARSLVGQWFSCMRRGHAVIAKTWQIICCPHRWSFCCANKSRSHRDPSLQS